MDIYSHRLTCNYEYNIYNELKNLEHTFTLDQENSLTKKRKFKQYITPLAMFIPTENSIIFEV